MKRKKPTNKEVMVELSMLEQKVMYLSSVVGNLSKVIDLYILFRKQDKKFATFIEKKAKEMNKKQEEENKKYKEDLTKDLGSAANSEFKNA